MSVSNYISIVFVVILTGIYYKIREQLNVVSKSIFSDQMLRNNIEIVIQPKWFLYSLFVVGLAWIYLVYNLFQTKAWWSILYAIVFYLVSGIAAYLLPIPSKKSIIRMFHRTVAKRVKEQHKYNSIDLKFINIAYEHLEKTTNL